MTRLGLSCLPQVFEKLLYYKQIGQILSGQFRIEEEHFFVELVFYNRLLRCYVLIYLKIGKFTHQDLADQLEAVIKKNLEVLGYGENKR